MSELQRHLERGADAVEVDRLRQRAKDLLNSLVNTPPGYGNSAVDECVDAIIGAAILSVTSALLGKKP